MSAPVSPNCGACGGIFAPVRVTCFACRRPTGVCACGSCLSGAEAPRLYCDGCTGIATGALAAALCAACGCPCPAMDLEANDGCCPACAALRAVEPAPRAEVDAYLDGRDPCATTVLRARRLHAAMEGARP